MVIKNFHAVADQILMENADGMYHTVY